MEKQIKGIAIIGMAGRFPGANNVDTFWQNLCQGVESISFFSDEEVLGTGVDPRLLHHPDYVKAWGIMGQEDLFDANFFGIPGREAEAMDPQHRHFLEVCVHTLENAGYNPETYDGLIGLICGVGISTYLLRNLSPNADRLQALGEYLTFIGNDKDFMGTRVAYKLNLRGGAHSVSTACSTTMVAVHLACRQLLAYESDMAIAGGANIKLPQKSGYLYRKGHLKSKDGRCHAFDERASGTVFGCGVAAVLLKRAQEAVEDGDPIYAVIRSSAINNDGNSKAGYTAPSVTGQTEVIAQAHELAGFDPETITHMEAHGTGTELGDPCEVKALTKVFRRNGGTKNQYCALTSVKTNIGHLDSVGGVAGLIKLALSLKHQVIPPSLNFERPNPEIDFANSPFYVNTELRPWQRIGDLPLRACISAFGAGGTNAHAVLEEAPSLADSDQGRPFQLLTLSAKTAPALAAMTSNLQNFVAAHPELNLADVAFTQNIGRMNHMHRRALVFSDRTSLLAALAHPEQAAACFTGVSSADGLAREAGASVLVKQVAAGEENEALETQLSSLAQMWVEGARLDWYDFYEGVQRHRLALPNYPFESVRYWIDQPDGLAVASEEVVGHSSLGPHVLAKKPFDQWFYEPSWQRARLSGPVLLGPDPACLVLFMDACGVAESLAARLEALGHQVVKVNQGERFRNNGVAQYEIDAHDVNHYHQLMSDLRAQGLAPAAIVHCWSVAADLDPSEVETLGFHSLIFLTQSLMAAFEDKQVQILAVANQTQDVLGGEPIEPLKTTLLAPVRVIPQEHAQLYCRAVDLCIEPGADLDALAGLLCEELQTKSAEAIIAYRRGRRWTQSWSKVDLVQSKRELKTGGTYLVTGGLGGIGFVLAEFLAQRYQARLIITGRASLPARGDDERILKEHGAESAQARRIGRLRYLEDLGAKVAYFQADASDRAALNEALRTGEAQLAPIDGVIHSAGLADLGLIQRKTPVSAAHIMAPKVQGTLYLADYFGARQLDFFMMCSSLASTLGGHGQVAYVAANTFQDAFAQQNAERGYLALNWDAWKETGMAVTFAQAAARLQKRSEVLDRQTEELQSRGISNLEGALAFERAIASGQPQIAVATYDLNERVAQSRMPVIHNQVVNEETDTATANYPRPELSTPFREANTDLERMMAQDWQHILGMERVGVDDDFFELGGDSLKGMNVINALDKRLGEQFHLEALLDMSNIAQLSRYILEEYPDAVRRIFGGSAPTAAPVSKGPVRSQDLAELRAQIPRMKVTPSGHAKNRQAVFILAPPRSGSTLLRVMLAGHSALLAPPELYLLNYATVKDREQGFTGETREWKNGLIQALMLVKDCSEPHARSLVENFVEKGQSTQELYHYLQGQIAALGGKRMLVDRTPVYSLSQETLACAERDFRDPLYIHLVRHPQAMIHSYKQAHVDLSLRHYLNLKLPVSSESMAEMLWTVSHENITTFLKDVPTQRQKQISFEALVSQPKTEMEGLCDFLGLTFEGEMLQPYLEKHRRMTEAINHETKPLGDAKFQQFRRIETGVAEAWRGAQNEDVLCSETWRLAESLGYQRPDQAGKEQEDLDDLLAQLDELSESDLDAEIARMAGL